MILWILLCLLNHALGVLNIDDGNLALSDVINFDAANNAWTVAITDIPKYTAIVPQICLAPSMAECGSTSHQTFMDCATLHGELLSAHWVMSENLYFDDNNCLMLSNTVDTSVGGLIRITHPPTLRIQNNITALHKYAASVSNTSSTLLVRVIFIQEHDHDLFETRQAHKNINLQTTANSGASLLVTHECRLRGLVAPRMSTLATVIDQFGVHVCTWRCPLSYVRQPFNSPPPLATEVNATDKMCVPIPDVFTAVKFELNVYMQVSSSGVPVLSQEFYDEINRLADAMRDESGGYYENTMVLLTVEGAVFGSMTIDEILLAHTIHKRLFSSYETINIVDPSRRLLEAVVVHGVAWFPVQGVVVIPQSDLYDIPELHQNVIDLTSSTLAKFSFEESLQVEGTDTKVTVRSLHRSVAADLPTTDTVMRSHDIAFYMVLVACVLIITGKTYVFRILRHK